MVDSQVRSAPQQLFDRTTEVPSLSTGSSQLLTKLMDGDIGVQDVLTSIDQHVVVVGKLISLANSAWSNPTVAVTTLDAACTRLGLDVVRTVAIALIVGRSFKVSNCPGFDRTRFWASSIVTSEIATSLALRFELDTMSARAAGLLQNIGLLWLADRLPEETSAVLCAVPNEPEASVTEQLERHCGIGYRHAGFLLLTHWQLPAILIAGVRIAEDSNESELHRRMHRLIDTSAHIASRVCAGDEDLVCDQGLEQDAALIDVFHEQRSKLSNTLELVSALIGA